MARCIVDRMMIELGLIHFIMIGGLHDIQGMCQKTRCHVLEFDSLNTVPVEGYATMRNSVLLSSLFLF